MQDSWSYEGVWVIAGKRLAVRAVMWRARKMTAIANAFRLAIELGHK
jgi:hypothetical protein